MTISAWKQVLAIVRLELRKTFFARRGLWIYLLAFAPVLLFLVSSFYAAREQERLVRIAAARPVTKDALDSIQAGRSMDDIVQALGEPYSRNSRTIRIGPQRQIQRDNLRYTDGDRDITFGFDDGELKRIIRRDPVDLPRATLLFAGTFQLYYVRLAIFFGCVGVFMNLFRGEMLDRSLHFYLLAPVSRDVLLAAKYLSGLIATVVIFSASTALQFMALLRQFDSATVSTYMQGGGWGHLASYIGVTVLACLGYGSIFLTAGLLFRNPIVPAAAVLIWEGANVFVPATLKKISLIYYLQSLCPIAPETALQQRGPLALLISVAEPVSTPIAIGSILLLTILMLFLASSRAHKLEINYSTD